MDADNGYQYTLIPSSQKALAESKGYVGGGKSDDGLWFIISKSYAVDCSDWVVLGALPQYMIDMGITDCGLTPDKAVELSDHPSFRGNKVVI